MRWVAIAVLLSVLVVGCGGNGDGGGSDISEDELSEALIGLDDLPSGWSLDTSEDSESGATFCDAEPVDEQINEGVKADRSFLRSETGPFLVQAVGAVSEDDAEEIMESMRGAFDCETWTDAENDTEWTVAEMNFPDVGDEHFAIRANAMAGFFTAEAQLVGFRVDGYVSIIGHIAIGEADVAFTEEMVELAAERLEDLP